MVSRPLSLFAWAATYARAAHLRSIQWPVPTVPWRLSEEVKYNRTFEGLRIAAETLQDVCRIVCENAKVPLSSIIDDKDSLFAVDSMREPHRMLRYERCADVVARRGIRPWVWYDGSFEKQLSVYWTEDVIELLSYARSCIPLSDIPGFDEIVDTMERSTRKCVPTNPGGNHRKAFRNCRASNVTSRMIHRHGSGNSYMALRGGGTTGGGGAFNSLFPPHKQMLQASVESRHGGDENSGTVEDLSSPVIIEMSATSGKSTSEDEKTAHQDPSILFLKYDKSKLPPMQNVKDALLTFARPCPSQSKRSCCSNRRAYELHRYSFIDATTMFGDARVDKNVSEYMWKFLTAFDIDSGNDSRTIHRLREIVDISELFRRVDTMYRDSQPDRSDRLHDSDSCRYCCAVSVMHHSPKKAPSPVAIMNCGDI
eukprot:GHVO01052851.1.p1 GENE.GHVO01052851.1~~GHVO01052851.1.p1  ORF type:complete len:425 (+),score=61.54 GHVO01052851.1:102-1376(+)